MALDLDISRKAHDLKNNACITKKQSNISVKWSNNSHEELSFIANQKQKRQR